MSSEIAFILFIIKITLIPFICVLLIKKKTNLPPGPKKLPIIGNLHQLGKLPHRTLRNLSKKYGNLMFLQLGFVPTIVISSADVAREVFKSHDLVFSGRPSLYGAKKISYDFGSISFAPYGEYWREIRKLVVLELMTAKRVQSFGNIRVDEVAQMMDRIIYSQKNKNLVDLSSLAFLLSNNVVCRVALGTMGSVDENGNGSVFQDVLGETQHLVGEFNVADYFPGLAWVNRFNGVDKRLEKNFQALDRFLDRVIQEHLDPVRIKPDVEDIIDVLLGIQKDSRHTWMALNHEHIKGVLLVDIFSAGTDTSATAIEWTMTELVRNPTVKQKVQQEVRQVAKGKTKVEETDLPKLAYLKLVIKESLRLHPPAPLMIPRETTEKCTIDNKYEIPAKTRVLFNASAIGMDPEYWENPERFWPDRFLNRQVDFRGQHFELLPFGAGRRGCPGINFSMPLVELALANLLFCFDWKLPEGMSAEDVDLEEAIGITMHKKIPLVLVTSSMD
ncbi:PREDICTED: cytochrome P450 71A9-like [Erythranthe guttata]|uniref:cytochrome P450 71A9-like n=1 Tax=Erythranthe guttata TaxID=4155 RepID=UPI00064E0F0D|nr:PREDICTED: cytochrome P450 71A9-like [Erythranthe guttata]|eukprot:XP_012855748.1 PREDICTED: cytochrome P450 71A9-like [Erythranthe guttata]